MNKHVITTLAACGLLCQAHAVDQKPATAPAAKPAAKPIGTIVPPKPKGLGLKDGDRFIFIGDSITHQCLYTQYVDFPQSQRPMEPHSDPFQKGKFRHLQQ